MEVAKQLAKHFRDLHYGGNWTWVNLKDTLADVNWQQATTPVHGLNTIAVLAYHTHYFVHAVLQVLLGSPLDAHDKFSFSHPPINSEADWDAFLATVWADADSFAALVEQLPDDMLDTTFSDEKYGTYYRNIQGIIEHTHYHLGQMVIIKKILGQM